MIQKIISFAFLYSVLFHTSVFAYRVFPSSGALRYTIEGLMDKKNFPFVAENADGIYIMPHGWLVWLRQAERNKLINQFKNKNVIIEGVYHKPDIYKYSEYITLPKGVNLTAYMMYQEPAIKQEVVNEMAKSKFKDSIIINNRLFVPNKSIRQMVDSLQGMSYECNVAYDTVKYRDVVAAIKYCIDRNKIILLLNPNFGTPAYNVSCYKSFFYYLKKNLKPEYFNSSKLIFSPSNYNFEIPFYITPEIEGSNTQMEICKWLIEQKTETNFQPEISFTSLKDKIRLDNHTNLKVNLDVKHSVSITNVKLMLDGKLVGEDNQAPFSFSDNQLKDLSPGTHELIAIATDANGKIGDRVINFRVLKDPLPVPGIILAGDCYTIKGSNEAKVFYLANIRKADKVTYQLDVKTKGIYNIKFNIFIHGAKNYGGIIILKDADGKKELGRVTTQFNDPFNRNKDLVSYPENIYIKNIALEKGIQTITLNFDNPNNPGAQFQLMDIDFQLQGAPKLQFTYPVIAKKLFQDYSPNNVYEAPANVSVSLEAIDSTLQSPVSKVELYINDKLVRSITNAPFEWNKTINDELLSKLPVGEYFIKAVAYNSNGLSTAKSFKIGVIERTAFTNENKIPGIIEAENYDYGGEGVSFHDLNSELCKLNYRWKKRDCVGIVETIHEKFAINQTKTDEWLEYTIDVQKDNNYDVMAYVSSTSDDKAFSIYIDGKSIGNIQPVPNTTKIGIYNPVTISNVAISKGKHVVRFVINNGGFNIDKMVFVSK